MGEFFLSCIMISHPKPFITTWKLIIWPHPLTCLVILIMKGVVGTNADCRLLLHALFDPFRPGDYCVSLPISHAGLLPHIPMKHLSLDSNKNQVNRPYCQSPKCYQRHQWWGLRSSQAYIILQYSTTHCTKVLHLMLQVNNRWTQLVPTYRQTIISAITMMTVTTLCWIMLIWQMWTHTPMRKSWEEINHSIQMVYMTLFNNFTWSICVEQ